MALAVVLLLVGCATTNPGEQAAQQAAGGVAGAVVGYKGAQKAGANQPWSVAGGVLGAGTGVAVVAGYQCDARGDCGNGYGRPSGAYSEMRAGNCPDPRGGEGSQISCQFLADNPCYARYGMYGPGAKCPDSTGGAGSYATQRQARSSSPGNFLGLTVGNYVESSNVITQCRTGNYGHDAGCLRNEAEILDARQKACVEGRGSCRNNYGAIAGAYRELAAKLSQRQSQLEARGY